jgi:hypothetical protein
MSEAPSKPKLYNVTVRYREGKLKARKVGRRTLVTSADLQEFLQTLPSPNPK